MSLVDSHYLQAQKYELLIRRAHKCPQQDRLGAHHSKFTALTTLENNLGSTYLGSKDKRLKDLIKYIDKALDKFFKRKLTPSEQFQLTSIKDQLQYAESSAGIYQLIEEALAVTERFS